MVLIDLGIRDFAAGEHSHLEDLYSAVLTLVAVRGPPVAVFSTSLPEDTLAQWIDCFIFFYNAGIYSGQQAVSDTLRLFGWYLLWDFKVMESAVRL